MKIRIGTRASKLALWQAHHVRDAIGIARPEIEVELVEITTQGDRIVDRPLSAIGGKGLFVKEIERALLDRDIDIAVHSAKDLPAEMPEGLVIGAVLEREDPDDILFSREGVTLEALPQGARVGTSSLRRRAMILAARPDLEVIDLRGNVPTRLRKIRESVDGLDAGVLAYAGMHRLGLDDVITQRLPSDVMMPAAGQGVVAVQARDGDTDVLAVLSELEHARTRACLEAERAALAMLEGSCHIPLGVLAGFDDSGKHVRVDARLVSPDGRTRIDARAEAPIEEARRAGEEVARALLDEGGRALLDNIGHAVPSPGSSSVLAGVPVLVTRSRTQAGKLSALLEAHGADAIEVPMIEIEPVSGEALDDALDGLGHGVYDWLVITSPNGVTHGLASVDMRNLQLGSTMVAVVGPATAEAWYEATGKRVDLVPTEHTSDGLLDALLAAGVSAGTRFLMLVAETTRDVLEDGLTDCGAEVDHVAVYRTEPSDEGRARLHDTLASHDAGWITLASSSAADALYTLIDEDVATLDGWRIACIGPVTARRARELGLRVDVVPETVGLAEMVVAMVDAQQGASEPSSDV